MKRNPQTIRGSLLIVEDEKIIAKDIANVLKKIGYVVPAIVASGEEALKKLEEIQVDLVLMDIVLKGDLDGIQVAQHIYDRFKIPVVYLSAYADDETLDRVKETELFGYIIKPFKERELFTTIDIALHKHRTAIEQQANDGRNLEEIQISLQKLQQFSDVKDILFKKFLEDLSGPLLSLNIAIQLLKESPSGPKREHYLRILEEEFSREVELVNQTSNLEDLLNVKNVELLTQFSLLKKQGQAEAASPQPALANSSGSEGLSYRQQTHSGLLIDRQPMPRSAGRPLNQTQLAERLGVVVSAITYWKFKSGFPEWSRSKDPDGLSWRYSPDSKRFAPYA